MGRHLIFVSLGCLSCLLAGCGLILEGDPPRAMDAAIPDTAVDTGGTTTGDAGAVDGGVCLPESERCNGVDDDCDGIVDEDFDFDSDVEHCGGCAIACPTEGGTASCQSGVCNLECRADRRNCDGDPVTGCEANLTDTETCGGCDTDCYEAGLSACSPEGSTFVCTAACSDGLVDCDGSCTDLETDVEHCGACGMGCFEDPSGTLECVSGACAVTDCGDGQADCNGDAADGCERRLHTNTDCLSCGDACGTGESCTRSGCAPMATCGMTSVCFASATGPGCSITCGSATLSCDAASSCACTVGGGTRMACAPVTPASGCDPCQEAFAAGCCSP